MLSGLREKRTFVWEGNEQEFFHTVSLPVIQSVSDVHVVGELFPQGGLQLALRLDGLQGLAELTLSDFLQADGVLQLAVEKLGVLLQPPDLVFQTLKFHLGHGEKALN